MFGFGKKKITMDIPAGSAPSTTPRESQGELRAPVIDASSLHVHTIPSKFLPKAFKEGVLVTKRVLWGIGGILVVSGLLIAASMLLVRSVRQKEAQRVQTNVNIPKIQNINVPQVSSRLIESDLGSCKFSRVSAGFDQELTVGGYSVLGYTASYFCETGSLAVQIFGFQDEESLVGRIQNLESQYRVFRDTVVQDAQDENKILWGSGKYFIQVIANSLLLEDTNFAVLLDEYLRLYPPTRNLPWKIAESIQLKTSQERDAKRVADIRKIQIALEFYKVDNLVYPAALDQTIDASLKDYLPEIPVNPEPGGTTYVYTQKLGGQSYEISFLLEEGSGGIPQGEVVAKPQGIFAKSQEVRSILPSSPDTDNDGLTDVEESLWGTASSLSDTDQDTYADGKEVRDGYDPVLPGDARLESSTLVKNYLSSVYHFTVLYPAAWSVSEPGEGQITFVSEDKFDFFEVLVEQAPQVNSIIEWYRSEFPSFNEEEVKTMTLSGFVEAVISPDGLTVYLLTGGKLFTITYNPGIKESLDYQTTFRMFLKTLTFFENPNP